MSWRKRRKLPPTVQVHLIDENTVEVFGRRLSSDQKDLIQTALGQPKRRQKYRISNHTALPLQKLAMDNKWEYEGVPVILLQLMEQLKTRKLDPFVTDNKPEFVKIWHTLHDHQQIGVTESIQHYKGKVLIGDEMGLGKTHEGVALILYYMHEGATLVVCPSYLRYHWENALVDLGGIDPAEICVIKKATDVPYGRFVIASYDIVVRDKCALKKGMYNMLLCDESHYLKNRKAKRTMELLNLSKTSKRVVLMTGTPALNKPIELFSQMHMIRPVFVKYSTHFAKRYCDGKMTDFGYDERGHSCDEELHWLLKKVYMVRRLKRDVLNLPKKTRQKIVLGVDDDCLEEIREGFKKWRAINQSLVHTTDVAIKQKKNHQRKALVSELFRQTARAKVNAMKLWFKDFLNKGEPVLFFAYHMETLDQMETICDGQEYIRIDGSTSMEKRQQYVDKFQRGEVKVALLSIMAAGTGITMTKASSVVFGELFWVPGIMIQAEDRAHRLTQENPVTVYHLLGKNTLDDHVYRKLIEKLKTLDALVDQREDRTLEGEYNVEEIDI
jgi:SNF2 family DNA or RNA helicase